MAKEKEEKDNKKEPEDSGNNKNVKPQKSSIDSGVSEEDSFSLNPPQEMVSPEEFEKLDPEAKKVVRKVFSASASFMASGSMQHPIYSKMDNEHITKVLDYSESESIRDHKIKSSNRFFHLTYVIILIAALLIFCILFEDKPEFLVPIVTAIGGALGGYGVGFSRGSNKGS